MKLMGLAVMAVCCILAGLRASGKLTARRAELEEAVRLCGLMEGNLRYTRSPMEELISQTAGQVRRVCFLPLCASYCKSGLPFPRAWQRALEEEPGAFARADQEVLLRLGHTLGALDVQSALQELECARLTLEGNEREAREQASKLGHLYRSLGMLAGAAVLILFW